MQPRKRRSSRAAGVDEALESAARSPGAATCRAGFATPAGLSPECVRSSRDGARSDSPSPMPRVQGEWLAGKLAENGSSSASDRFHQHAQDNDPYPSAGKRRRNEPPARFRVLPRHCSRRGRAAGGHFLPGGVIHRLLPDGIADRLAVLVMARGSHRSCISRHGPPLRRCPNPRGFSMARSLKNSFMLSAPGHRSVTRLRSQADARQPGRIPLAAPLTESHAGPVIWLIGAACAPRYRFRNGERGCCRSRGRRASAKRKIKCPIPIIPSCRCATSWSFRI